jgi:hypothetical protein
MNSATEYARSAGKAYTRICSGRSKKIEVEKLRKELIAQSSQLR